MLWNPNSSQIGSDMVIKVAEDKTSFAVCRRLGKSVRIHLPGGGVLIVSFQDLRVVDGEVVAGLVFSTEGFGAHDLPIQFVGESGRNN